MLITGSYFVGDIQIPGWETLPILQRLNYYIAKYEPIFLKKALGYTFWKEFVAGLDAVTVDQKWTDLLYGKDEYEGLIILPPGATGSVSPAQKEEIVIVSDASSITIPAAFVGSTFEIERRAFGTLRADEYEVTGNQLSLIGSQFTAGETFFLRKGTTLLIDADADDTLRSPIANYIYWHWMEANNTKTAGQGEVKPKGENSTSTSPDTKMRKAWNEMARQMRSMARFIDKNSTDYPTYSTDLVLSPSTYRGMYGCRNELYEPVNMYGI